jgi:hypothetical protein
VLDQREECNLMCTDTGIECSPALNEGKLAYWVIDDLISASEVDEPK